MDLYVSNLIYGLRSPILDSVMLFITYLGDWQVIFAGTVIACIFFAIKRCWFYVAAILFSVGGGEILVWLIKNFARRPRPILDDGLVTETSFSFPSGHAFISVAFYGLLIYFLLRASKNRLLKIFIAAAWAILALAMGISRIYLGVHWFTDVAAGFTLGGIWLCAIIFALKNIKNKKEVIKL